MSNTIKSKSDLFTDMNIEKLKQATVIYDAKGEPLYKCPNCGNIASDEECDVIGAEPDCLFCNQCNHEFHQ